MRNENGILVFKENWFLRNVWLWNSLKFFLGEEIDFPKNLCSLFWGSLFGLFIGTPITLISYILAFGGCIICGFFGYYFGLSGPKSFYPYKHIGRKKIPIAAWEVFTGLFVVYIFMKDGAQVLDIISVNYGVILATIIIIIAVISIVVGVCHMIPWKIFWGYLKARKKRFCPIVRIEKEDDEICLQQKK